ERVADVVGELDDLVSLIVMSENDEPTTERRAGRGNPMVHLLVGQTDIARGERLPLADVFFLVFRQDVEVHGDLVKRLSSSRHQKSQTHQAKRPALSCGGFSPTSMLTCLKRRKGRSRGPGTDAQDGWVTGLGTTL